MTDITQHEEITRTYLAHAYEMGWQLPSKKSVEEMIIEIKALKKINKAITRTKFYHELLSMAKKARKIYDN